MLDARFRFGRGLNVTYTESVKRIFYTASLVPSQLEADSFSELFKAAAIGLATAVAAAGGAAGNSTDAPVTAFIFEWGNFLIDQVSSR